MYECRVLRFTKYIKSVHIYKDGEEIRRYQINLRYGFISRADINWYRKITPLELMVGGIEIKCWRNRYLVMFNGPSTEDIEAV